MEKQKVGEIEEDVGTFENPFSTIALLKKLIFNPRTYIYIYINMKGFYFKLSLKPGISTWLVRKLHPAF